MWNWYCCTPAEISQEDTLSIILQFFSFVAVWYSSLKDVVLCFNSQAIIQEKKLPCNVVIIHWLSTLNYLNIQMHSVIFVVMNTNNRQCPRDLDWKQIGIVKSSKTWIEYLWLATSCTLTFLTVLACAYTVLESSVKDLGHCNATYTFVYDQFVFVLVGKVTFILLIVRSVWTTER